MGVNDGSVVPFDEQVGNLAEKNTKPDHQDQRFKYAKEFIDKLLNLKIEGRSWSEISLQFNVPMNTLMQWRNREIKNATEIGKRLCQSNRWKSKAINPETISFPGGSVYTAGEDGKAVSVVATPERTTDERVADEELVDQIIHELTLKIGRQFVEITSLRAKLKKYESRYKAAIS